MFARATPWRQGISGCGRPRRSRRHTPRPHILRLVQPEPDNSTPPRLPPRDPGGHKGTFGTLGVVGGSAGDPRMIGAPALAARAALRAGVGLVKLASPEPVLDAVMGLEPSATGVPIPADASGAMHPHEAAAVIDRLLAEVDALVVGPGLGRCPGVSAATIRAITQDQRPVVLDADALNCLAETPSFDLDFHAPAILTPHPGEYQRLAEALRISGDPRSPEHRPAAAAELAARLGCVVVLKGRHTVVTDGLRAWTCTAGHPCLATAGTGDVLAGLIGALVAGLVDPMSLLPLPDAARARRPVNPARPLDLYDAARVGVLAHAQAGEAWPATSNAQAGLLARELADLLPGTLARMTQSA